MILHDVMIDFETLSTKPTAAVIQLGYLRFDIATGTKGLGRKLNIDLDSCLEKGLTVEASTFNFWMEQSHRRNVTHLYDSKPVSLDDALNIFTSEIPSVSRLWSRGASFDIPILINLFHVTRRDFPWSYQNFQCQRTYINLALSITEFKLPRRDPETEHHSLYDCNYQVDCLVAADRALRGEFARLQALGEGPPKNAA